MDYEQIVRIKPYKINIARYFLITAMLVALGSGVVNFIYGNTANLYGSVLTLICVPVTLYITRLESFRFAANVIAVTIPISFSLFNLTFYAADISTYIWLSIMPVFFLVILNIYLGITLSLILLAYAITIYYLNYSAAINNVIGVEDFSQLVIVYLFALITLSINETHQRNDEGELERQINYDYLTEILNRRGILSEMDRSIRYASRYNTLLSIILIDIDNFKKLNDQYGHDVGDHVLKYFANLLRLNVRESDYVGRYGGEEFLIIVPGLPVDATKLFAEKLRQLTEDYVQITGSNMTASFGVTQYKAGETREVVLKRADMAMYSAKTQKNTVREM